MPPPDPLAIDMASRGKYDFTTVKRRCSEVCPTAEETLQKARRQLEHPDTPPCKSELRKRTAKDANEIPAPTVCALSAYSLHRGGISLSEALLKSKLARLKTGRHDSRLRYQLHRCLRPEKTS